jgi:hypothetical protein
MSLVWLVAYFLPTLLAWAIVKRVNPVFNIGLLFLLNLLTAWTIVGWFVCLVYPFLQNRALLKRGGTYSPAAAAAGWESPQSSMARCSSCDGGWQPCLPCAGQGGRDVNGQWQACTACTASGKIRCLSCGGTGHMRF